MEIVRPNTRTLLTPKPINRRPYRQRQIPHNWQAVCVK